MPISIVLRSVAALLLALWVGRVVALVLAAGARPPDLAVLVAAAAPAGAAAIAVAWPPRFAGRRAQLTVLWLAIASALILAPLVGEALLTLWTPLVPLVPSPAATYAGLVAAAGTSLLAGLGAACRFLDAADTRARTAIAGALAVALVLPHALGAGRPVTAAVAGLPERGAGTPSGGPAATCGSVPATHPSAHVVVSAEALVDGAPVAAATSDGNRDHADRQWSARGHRRGGHPGDVAAPTVLALEYIAVADQGWIREAPAPWRPDADPGGPGRSTSLDGGVYEVVASWMSHPAVVEDLGVELRGGEPVRHCRRATDGPTAMTAFPLLHWLVGGTPFGGGPRLDVWRGHLDWWSSGDGALRAATVSVGGHPADAWPESDGVRASLRATLAVDEPANVPLEIMPPQP